MVNKLNIMTKIKLVWLCRSRKKITVEVAIDVCKLISLYKVISIPFGPFSDETVCISIYKLIRRYIVRYASKGAGHAIYHTSICFLAHVLFIAGPSQRPPIKHGQNTCPVVRLIEQPKYSIAYWQPWSRHEHQIIYITTGSRHTVMMNKAGWHIAKSQPSLQTKHICRFDMKIILCFLGLSWSMSWLLMPWRLASTGHQHPWYWPCRIGRSWSYMRPEWFQLPVSC